MSSKVNRPVDPQVRDRDIENKLRLYGIYNAFANGKLPSNKQIDVALNSVSQLIPYWFCQQLTRITAYQ